jgi:F-box associated protein
MTLLRRRPAPGKALPSPSHTALEPPSPPPPSACLDSLPTELHLLIASHLPYPDALSLKHTSRHFYRLVDTGVRLKVAWLVSRHELHLDCPSDSRCDLRNDSNFCRGSVRSVCSILTSTDEVSS